ncbi:hypothetical protein DFH08DRAFT_891756, partial [Mycena albidolilacea]
NLTPFISMPNHYNLLHREEEREMMPSLKHFGIGSIPWSPLYVVRSPVWRARRHLQRRRHCARKATSYPRCVLHPRCAFEMCRDVAAVVLREYLIVKQVLAPVDRSTRTTRTT